MEKNWVREEWRGGKVFFVNNVSVSDVLNGSLHLINTDDNYINGREGLTVPTARVMNAFTLTHDDRTLRSHCPPPHPHTHTHTHTHTNRENNLRAAGKL